MVAVSLKNFTDTPEFFQAEDGIRDYYASRGLGDVYKRQVAENTLSSLPNVVVLLAAVLLKLVND